MARSRSSSSSANIGFEAKLWSAADKLRSNMDAGEYKHVVLGLIFLKYLPRSTSTFELLPSNFESALPGQLFYSTQIPVCLWFLSKSKAARVIKSSDKATADSFRGRRCETLFTGHQRRTPSLNPAMRSSQRNRPNVKCTELAGKPYESSTDSYRKHAGRVDSRERASRAGRYSGTRLAVGCDLLPGAQPSTISTVR
jgi:hypothetical protein